jgi:hypothetical protein
LPAAALDAVLGGGAGDPDAWPEGVFYGCVPTEGSIESISVKNKPGKDGYWVAIDLIGAINFITSVVSIDEHDMWVYAMDGSYIEPQKVGPRSDQRRSILSVGAYEKARRLQDQGTCEQRATDHHWPCASVSPWP